MVAVYTLLNVDRGVPEVWQTTMCALLDATVKLRDGKKLTDMELPLVERIALKEVLKKVSGTDIEKLLKEYNVIVVEGLGRGRFSKRMLLPQTPSPEEWLGIGLALVWRFAPMLGGRVFLFWVVVTAGRQEPPRPANAGHRIVREAIGRRFPKGDRKATRRAPSFGRARRHGIPRLLLWKGCHAQSA